MTVTAAELLDKAAEVLERDGWCRHTVLNGDGQRCVVGGILGAMGLLGLPTSSHVGVPYFQDPVYIGARDTLAKLLGETFISQWNDERALDGADVVNHLRKAAEIARGT